MKKNNNKGFTLAELLIVVAIIAVLVAIAIPVFNSQLEKSREATDVANIRSAYANMVANVLTEGKSQTMTVTTQAKVAGWATSPAPKLKTMIDGTEGSVAIPDTAGGSVTVKVGADGKVSF